MGRTKRQKPKRLARKLLAIRLELGVSQTQMAKLLRLKKAYTAVSAYERGAREPDLLVLLRYAKLAHASIDVLVDDMKDLPRK
ncbi:MAG: Helix-turn-helix domain [Blastocatellia bacterium]|jgi:transcriptional regulator with XRE-family HTH domain|nr:Helix-turn-helix domain [Blastocatellia bacterium]